MYSNVDGAVSNLRSHLKKAHSTEYLASVKAHDLHRPKDVPEDSTPKDKLPRSFTLSGFYERLIPFIAVSNQVSALI